MVEKKEIQADMPHWPPVHKGKFVLGLKNISSFLEALGDPQNSLPPIIHVAGTNGKGSTIAFMHSMMNKAGYSCHRYISPHIVKFAERIYLSDHMISDGDLFSYLEKCRIKSEETDINVSFFEGITSAALLAFSLNKADFTLLEVGMGGRLDATNVVPSPQLCIITPISFDHVEYLGDALYNIAKEKAGIIKPGTKVVISWQVEEAMRSIKERCEELGVEYLAWGEDWNFSRNSDDSLTVQIICSEKISKKSSGGEAIKTITIPTLGLKGIHQYINAAASVVAAFWLKDDGYEAIDDAAIIKGIGEAKWPGRLERVKKGSLATVLGKDDELWLDGAHNVGGAEMLSASISDMQNHDRKLVYLINGRTGNRDPRAFLQFFVGLAEMICGVRVLSEPSAEKPENIVKDAEELGIRAVVADDLLDAVKKCYRDANGRPCRIVICGSLYLAGDADYYYANKE